MSIVNELVKNVLETTFASFDEATIERAKIRVIDVVGCILSGSTASGCLSLKTLVDEWGGKKESSILVFGGKYPAHQVAMVNSVMARSYDFEPAGPVVDGKNAPGHVSGTTVPTAIATAEQMKVNGKDFLTALIVGDDLASRINAASVFGLNHGWDCVGTANTFGATAIAGKLYGLSPRQMGHAFGIVVNQLSGTMQNFFDGAHAFKLVQGFAARSGIVSSMLAKHGFTGIADPFFSKYGYFSLYCKKWDASVLTKKIGQEFYADCTIKPYPCCRANHASIDGALELIQKHHIKPEQIREVVVEIPPAEFEFAVGQPFQIREVPQIDASFNLEYCLASVFLRGDLRLRDFSDQAIKDPGIPQMIRRITLAKSVDLEKSLSSKVRVTIKDNRTFETQVDIPKGDERFTPLAKAEKRNKFLDNSNFSGKISVQKAKKALNLLENMEEIDDLSEVTELLMPN